MVSHNVPFHTFQFLAPAMCPRSQMDDTESLCCGLLARPGSPFYTTAGALENVLVISSSWIKQ